MDFTCRFGLKNWVWINIHILSHFVIKISYSWIYVYVKYSCQIKGDEVLKEFFVLLKVDFTCKFGLKNWFWINIHILSHFVIKISNIQRKQKGEASEENNYSLKAFGKPQTFSIFFHQNSKVSHPIILTLYTFCDKDVLYLKKTERKS